MSHSLDSLRLFNLTFHAALSTYIFWRHFMWHWAIESLINSTVYILLRSSKQKASKGIGHETRREPVGVEISETKTYDNSTTEDTVRHFICMIWCLPSTLAKGIMKLAWEVGNCRVHNFVRESCRWLLNQRILKWLIIIHFLLVNEVVNAIVDPQFLTLDDKVSHALVSAKITLRS